MSPVVRFRHRMNVVLHMVLALITAILFAQLWLFTVAVDAMENHAISGAGALTATIVSALGAIVIWALITFFLRTEQTVSGPHDS